MKKILSLLLLSVLLSISVFAQESSELESNEKAISGQNNEPDNSSSTSEHFLLGLDGDFHFYVIDYFDDGDIEFRNNFYVMPFLETQMLLPSKSNFRMYVGMKAFSVILQNDLRLFTKIGYAFNRPENWQKYHFELLGTAGFGLTGPTICPVADLGIQLYLMPYTRGFYAGVGPF